MTTITEQVQAALADADREGRATPGRPALARALGVSEYQVRKALRVLAAGGAELTLPPGVALGEVLVRRDALAAEHDSELVATPASAAMPAWVQEHSGFDPDELAAEAGDPLAGAGDPSVTDGEPLASTPAADAPARAPRAWPLAVIAVGAAVAVWSGWVGLGELTGFGVVRLLPGLWDGLRLNTAVVLPLSVEAYGAYALRCWLGAAAVSVRTRAFARRSAITSLAIGAGAQVAYHLMVAAGVRHAPWPVVVLVSCVPVVVLGLASALARLVTSDHQHANHPRQGGGESR